MKKTMSCIFDVAEQTSIGNLTIEGNELTLKQKI